MKRTTSKINNSEKGNVTFIGLLFLLFLSGSFLFTMYQMKFSLQNLKVRTSTYLCLKNYINKTLTYIKVMNGINDALYLLSIGELIPATSIYANKTKPALAYSQEALFVKYKYDTMNYSYCSRTQAVALGSHSPYKRNRLKFKREFFSKATLLKKNKWKVTIPAFNKRFFMKKSFYIQASFSASGNTTLSPKIEETKEFSRSSVWIF
jgi:hypothetical protein